MMAAITHDYDESCVVVTKFTGAKFSTLDGKHIPVDFAGGERGVEEETNLDVGISRKRDFLAVDAVEDVLHLVRGHLADVLWTVNEGAEEHGEEHEVVVLYPDHVARLDLRADSLCEA